MSTDLLIRLFLPTKVTLTCPNIDTDRVSEVMPKSLTNTAGTSLTE